MSIEDITFPLTEDITFPQLLKSRRVQDKNV